MDAATPIDPAVPMPDEVPVRPAADSDALAIADVFLAARREMTYVPRLHTDEETRAWIARVVLADCEVWVGVRGGRVVGFAALGGGWLEHLYVAPAAQGSGVGSRLLDQVKRLRPDGLRLFTFEGNTGARRFYERHGFVVVDAGDDNEEELPDLTYAWPGAAGT